jgi:hypothetical protein
MLPLSRDSVVRKTSPRLVAERGVTAAPTNPGSPCPAACAAPECRFRAFGALDAEQFRAAQSPAGRPTAALPHFIRGRPRFARPYAPVSYGICWSSGGVRCVRAPLTPR